MWVVRHTAKFPGCVEQRSLDIHPDDFDPGVLFFKVTCRTGNSTAGTHAWNQNVDLPRGLFPQLRSSRVVMRFRIGWIVILVRQKTVWGLFDYSCGHAVITAVSYT